MQGCILQEEYIQIGLSPSFYHPLTIINPNIHAANIEKAPMNNNIFGTAYPAIIVFPYSIIVGGVKISIIIKYPKTINKDIANNKNNGKKALIIFCLFIFLHLP